MRIFKLGGKKKGGGGCLAKNNVISFAFSNVTEIFAQSLESSNFPLGRNQL